MSRLFGFITIALIVVLAYFFSYQFQKVLVGGLTWLGKKIGVYSASREHDIQRYVYLHRSSIVAHVYNWVNEQLIASGMKRLGVTPFGYILFWGLVSIVVAVILIIVTNIGIALGVVAACLIFGVFLVLTRVLVSGQMERREGEIMDALDLIIPEIGGGVQRAISNYIDNFAPSLQPDFRLFLSNRQDRGHTFEDAMYILADSMGRVFADFAQKAIAYEAQGDPEMLGIFDDVTETNRQRRELRYINEEKFSSLRWSFAISSLIAVGYFIFLMATDGFSRWFFLTHPLGIALLIVIFLIIFGVLAYIATLKSRAI